MSIYIIGNYKISHRYERFVTWENKQRKVFKHQYIIMDKNTNKIFYVHHGKISYKSLIKWFEQSKQKHWFKQRHDGTYYIDYKAFYRGED